MKTHQQKIEVPPTAFPQPKLPPPFRLAVGPQTLGAFRVPADVEEPEVQLAADGNLVVAVWRSEGKLQIATSTDGGARYTVTPLSVGATPGTIEGWPWHPQVAVGDGLVVIAYIQRRRLLVHTSTDGVRFSAPWVVASNVSESLNNTTSERYELLAYSDRGFGIVWWETVERVNHLKFLRLEPRNFARQSVAESSSLASVPLRRLTLTPLTLSRPTFGGNAARLFAAGAELRVFFSEDQNPEYVQAMVSSRDGGRTFETLASAVEGMSGLLGERRTKGEAGGIVKPLTEIIPLKVMTPAVLPGRGEYLPTGLSAYREGVPLGVLGPESATQGLFRGRLRNIILSNMAPEPQPEARREETRFERAMERWFQVAPATVGVQMFFVDGWANTTRQLTKVWTCSYSGGVVGRPIAFSEYGVLTLAAGVLGDRTALVACQKTATGYALLVRWVRGAAPLGDWLLLATVPSLVRSYKLVPTARGVALLWIEGLSLRSVQIPAP